MQDVTVQAVPAQTLKVVLAEQNCQINIYQKEQGLFVDIIANGETLVSAVIARDAVPLMCRDYLSFAGNLMFIDTQGASDPEYSTLGSRFKLVYLTADEYALF